MLTLALLIACDPGKVVLNTSGTDDSDIVTDDTGPSGDEGGDGGGNSGGGSSGGADGSGSSSGGTDSGSSGGGTDTGSGGGNDGSGGEGGGDPPEPDYAGTYTGKLWMEVPDWDWSCEGDLELVVDDAGAFDQDANCSADSGWGSYDTPVRLVGVTSDGGVVAGVATIEMYYSGDITATITGTLGGGDIALSWETEIDSGWGDTSTGTGGFDGRR